MSGFAYKPIFRPGMTIGLLGGSFDPPHEGHILVSERLAVMLGLDFVWWLVSPQNPLKPDIPPDSAMRVAACRELIGKRPIYVSDIEKKLRTRHTIDTVRWLKTYYPTNHFIWLMGADNLCQLHRWKDWRALMQEIAMAIYPRHGDRVKAGLAPAAACFANYRYAPHEAHLLKFATPPAWLLTGGNMSKVSSSILRSRDKHGYSGASGLRKDENTG